MGGQLKRMHACMYVAGGNWRKTIGETRTEKWHSAASHFASPAPLQSLDGKCKCHQGLVSCHNHITGRSKDMWLFHLLTGCDFKIICCSFPDHPMRRHRQSGRAGGQTPLPPGVCHSAVPASQTGSGWLFWGSPAASRCSEGI